MERLIHEPLCYNIVAHIYRMLSLWVWNNTIHANRLQLYININTNDKLKSCRTLHKTDKNKGVPTME